MLLVTSYSVVDTSVGVVKDLTSGPNSPDIELHFSPAIVPNFFDFGRSGDYGITMVRDPNILHNIRPSNCSLGWWRIKTR